MGDETIRPPVGVHPTWLWLNNIVSKNALTNRLNDINNAIIRYINSNMEIPIEWITERNIIAKAIKEY